MKALRSIIKTTLVFGISLIALLGLFLFLLFPKKLDPENYAAFVRTNAVSLTDIANAALAGHSDPSILQRLLLTRAKVEYIWPKEDRVILALDSAYAPMEGHLHLIYLPDGEYAFHFNSPEWHFVETADEHILRWEGSYMGGRGWVNVTQLSEYFYLEEAYLPT